ncbi:MAG: c-type cytochrome [Chakrabartia godavariana]
MKTFTALAALALLSACGSKPAEDTGSTSGDTAATDTSTNGTETASADVRPAAWAQCAACHTIAKDAPHALGPNLWGVAGTKSGEIKGYEFSPAMKAAGLTWDEPTLDKYLENPRAMVPGTKMSFGGIADAAKRKELVTWLLAQK